MNGTMNSLIELVIYHVDYMNDPAEGRALIDFKEGNTETSEFLTTIFEKGIHSNEEDAVSLIAPSMYSLSFTESSDRLDLWRAYGSNGDGYSIVTLFDAVNKNKAYEKHTLDAFEKHKNSEVNTAQENINLLDIELPLKENIEQPVLFRVFYGSKEKKETINLLSTPLKEIEKLYKELDKPIQKEVEHLLYAVLLEIMYLYKDEQYSTEREARVIQVMPLSAVLEDERKPGRLYCETTPFLFLKEESKIVIEPKIKNKQASLWNLRYRLKKNGFGNTTNVSISKVKYR